MLNIELTRDGRSWYGRKLYRINLASRAGTLSYRNLTPAGVSGTLGPLVTQLLVEERPFSITDVTLPTKMQVTR